MEIYFLFTVSITIVIFFILIYTNEQNKKMIELLKKTNDEYHQKIIDLIKSKFELEKENIELEYKLDIERNKSELYKIELDKTIELNGDKL